MICVTEILNDLLGG